MMVMGINSIVDYASRIAAFCFRPISSADEFGFTKWEIGFHRCLPRKRGAAGRTRVRQPDQGDFR
jgi:hypothetical protein